MDHKLKLMVVDDSPLFRTWLIRSLSDPAPEFPL